MTSESVDGTQKSFNHPFLQATGIQLLESKRDRYEMNCYFVRNVLGRNDVHVGILVHKVES